MKPRRRPRHPQIHLPPLDAASALGLVEVFERAIAAVWRAHGDRMAALLERRAAMRPDPPRQSGPVDDDDAREHDEHEDDLLPF